MKGTSRIVILRSRSLDKVREAMIAGTEQPNPMSMGTKLLPERPRRRSGLSITNATRAMYPLSSRMERNKNSVTMTGKNPSTASHATADAVGDKRAHRSGSLPPR